MNPIAVCAFALFAVCTLSAVKRLNPEPVGIGMAVCGAVISVYVAEALLPFVNFVKETAAGVGASGSFSLLLKALSVSVCCRMSADICRDCGENLLASRVELAGKAGIVLISLPLVKNLLEIAEDLAK